jgi:hypothetical protein
MIESKSTQERARRNEWRVIRQRQVKVRGVYWQKNRNRWMSRYTLTHRGEKNINLGAFIDAKHAALVFDSKARRRGRLEDTHLNFPNLHPCEGEIEAWTMNGTHYSMMGSQHKNSSQYRGLTIQHGAFQVQVSKVLAGLGKKWAQLAWDCTSTKRKLHSCLTECAENTECPRRSSTFFEMGS